MVFTDKTLETIDKTYYTNWKKTGYCNGVLGLEIHGDRLTHNSMVLCELTNLSRVIDELTMYREAIKEVTGIEF